MIKIRLSRLEVNDKIKLY